MAVWLMSCLWVLMGLIGAQSAVADGSGNADVVTGAGCMEDVAGFGLNCTANDIQIASVTNLTILDDGCAFPGDSVTFTADFEVLLTAQARHDLGLWFAEDGDPNGDGALTGTCTVATPAYAPDTPWLDLDGTGDKFLDTNITSNIQDTCGDIDDDHNPLFPTVTLTVQCIDTDGDGQLNLPNCTSWKQPGDNDLCTSPIPVADVGGPGLDSSGVPPGSPAKCRCDDGFQVPINVPGQIVVDKVTFDSNGDPLPGDPTSFDFALTGGPDSVNVPFSLTDASDPFASSFLDAGTYQVTETVPADWALTSASCTSDSGTPNDTNDDVTFAYTNGADIALSAGEIITCTFNDTLVFVPAPAIDLVKDGALDLGGDGVANVGDLISYTFQVTNVGNVDLSSAAVTDPMVSPIACPQTTLFADPDGEAPFVGETMTCTGSYAITQADIDAGQKDNTATAQGTDPNGTTVEDMDSHSEPITQAPALTLEKTSDVATYDAVGDLITYTYVVTNTGNQTLTNVTLADPLAGLSAISCVPTQPSTLAPTESMTCTATYTITQTDIDNGSVVNTATADSDQTDPVDDSVTVTAVQSPALTLDKTADVATYSAVGDVITYTYVATNSGNQTLTNVTISDPLAGLSALSCTPAQPATLAPTEAITCTATYTITQTDIDNGSVVNTATADSDQTDPVDDSVTVTADQTPALSVVKVLTGNADEDGSGTVSLGDTLSYTLTATNDGNQTLTNVVVSDSLTGDSTSCLSVAPGDTCVLTVTYVVTQADVDAGVINNVGTADSDETPPTTDPEEVPVPQNPSIAENLGNGAKAK